MFFSCLFVTFGGAGGGGAQRLNVLVESSGLHGFLGLRVSRTAKMQTP